jgi:hypothetical protein
MRVPGSNAFSLGGEAAFRATPSLFAPTSNNSIVIGIKFRLLHRHLATARRMAISRGAAIMGMGTERRGL